LTKEKKYAPIGEGEGIGIALPGGKGVGTRGDRYMGGEKAGRINEPKEQKPNEPPNRLLSKKREE